LQNAKLTTEQGFILAQMGRNIAELVAVPEEDLSGLVEQSSFAGPLNFLLPSSHCHSIDWNTKL